MEGSGDSITASESAMMRGPSWYRGLYLAIEGATGAIHCDSCSQVFDQRYALRAECPSCGSSGDLGPYVFVDDLFRDCFVAVE